MAFALNKHRLVFGFPQIHPSLWVFVDFQRTLRLPETDKVHSLPPGLGKFPLVAASDFAVPDAPAWLARADALMPIYQAEAMWMNFTVSHQISDIGSGFAVPVALKIEAGGINAITGAVDDGSLSAAPQNYVVLPNQPWLDGFAVAPGVVRQFVAAPLGSGASIEEQLTGKADCGGIAVTAIPMRADIFRQRLAAEQQRVRAARARYAAMSEDERLGTFNDCDGFGALNIMYAIGGSMGFGMGGKMRQRIYDDPHGLDVWDVAKATRVELGVVNARDWQSLTGSAVTHKAPTAADYTKAGLPWFDLYDEHLPALAGSAAVAGLKTVGNVLAATGGPPAPVASETVVMLGTGVAGHRTMKPRRRHVLDN